MMSDSQKNFTVPYVRTLSEESELAFSIMDTKTILLEILDDFNSLFDFDTNQEKFTELAIRLSKIAGKSPAWGWRYVQSVSSGTVKPSEKFSDAVNIMAISFLDNVPMINAKSSPVTVYAETGTISEGAYVMVESVRCASPTCTVTFVPNVPWRKYCPICRPHDE